MNPDIFLGKLKASLLYFWVIRLPKLDIVCKFTLPLFIGLHLTKVLLLTAGGMFGQFSEMYFFLLSSFPDVLTLFSINQMYGKLPIKLISPDFSWLSKSALTRKESWQVP